MTLSIQRSKRERGSFDPYRFATGRHVKGGELEVAAAGNRKFKRKRPLENQRALKLVAKGGIEPPTRGFSIRCSTN